MTDGWRRVKWRRHGLFYRYRQWNWKLRIATCIFGSPTRGIYNCIIRWNMSWMCEWLSEMLKYPHKKPGDSPRSMMIVVEDLKLGLQRGFIAQAFMCLLVALTLPKIELGDLNGDPIQRTWGCPLWARVCKSSNRQRRSMSAMAVAGFGRRWLTQHLIARLNRRHPIIWRVNISAATFPPTLCRRHCRDIYRCAMDAQKKNGHKSGPTLRRSGAAIGYFSRCRHAGQWRVAVRQCYRARAFASAQ